MRRLIIAWSLMQLACEATPAAAVPTMPLERCHIEGSPRPAMCGTLARPEDPNRADGPQLSIRVVVLPASGTARRNPLYLLAGGPGQGASEAFAPLLGRFKEIGRERDIVLVDQRGTGSSSPLQCEDELHLPLAKKLEGKVDVALLRACLERYEVDPRNFTTAIAIEDLDAVRDALGQEHIDLFGGSYGTRVALAYARAHPDRVGRMVIDGVAPVDMTLPLSFARDAEAALEATFADCAAQPSCAAAFPDGLTRFRRWLDELRGAPRRTKVEDPRTYDVAEVELRADIVAFAVRGTLYSPELAAMLPLALDRATHGDLDPLIAQSLMLVDSVATSMSTGMHLSVVCAEDVPFIDDAALASETSGTMLGRRMVELMRESCAVWPRAELPADWRTPVRVDTPTLVLSGALDPVTPPRWGEHALEGLSAGRHLVVPGTGHGTVQHECVAELMRAFLDGSDSLDITCLDELARPPFFVDLAGPPA